MGKKNLDKLFHEKLKDFSEVPDDKVWQSIEASLDKKKKSRKVIPIWWKLGGVAAVLLLAITLINPFEDNSSVKPVVTDVKVDTEKSSEENKTESTFENQTSNDEQIVDAQQETIPDEQNSSTNQVANTETISKENSESKMVQESSKKEVIKNQNALGVQVANSDKVEVRKAIEQNQTKAAEYNFDQISEKAEVADSDAPKNKLEENLSRQDSDAKMNKLVNEIVKSSDEGITQNDKEEVSEAIDEESKKKSIFDEIAEQEQEEVIAENSGSKWSAGPSIAPVYFSAMGEGSPVHSIFVPNSKSGDVNLSYGLSVAYEVSKKLSIRSGVHKVDYGYRTNDVEFSSSLESATNSQIDNIDYSLTSRNLVVSSKVNTRIESLNQNPFLDTSSDVSAVSAARDGVMEQQFGYLEVPVELNYVVLDNRFGINLIGGVSSLFLVDNSISLSSGELTTEVGEANNVNSVNFSTNVGFGMNYKVTPKVQLNIEPVFKYQLNTFSETDGTFNPFSVGVYSGLSFKF
ncbi:hypothetical protein FEE95_05515 [Maribacter algarum]|uniref:Outer membrane protein beta-barrel domain-containing protein n=1 Tax=Maribacter algarum (ex Zhang et al. 2020) TaxID=2578118 RepID=A0A5S3PVB7_9FLAO|nr:hypothetical protein [Maribacter algarum]TMM58890.1 hypothetical protein FEE95_05515 [Maribacter algarum]